MNLLEKNVESYNSQYVLYSAKWCRATGLPMYSHQTFEAVLREGLYTRSRAAREKVDIDTETVCGWYRMYNGYVPLFRESAASPSD